MIHLYKIPFTLVVLVWIGVIALGCEPAAPPVALTDNTNEEDWIQLFNGTDLNDWDIKIRGYELNDNFGNTFRVADGLLQVGYEAYESYDDRFGHIFHKQPYSHYTIAVEYRFIGDQAPNGPGWALRNSGIMVHGQPASTMALNQDFPISIEVQLLGGDGEGERTTANLCTPGTHVEMDGVLVTEHCISSRSATYHGDQWVLAEVTVLGDSLITHVVEGDTVMQYTSPQVGGEVVNDFDPAQKRDGERLTEGYISLQSESHPVEFRKVEVLNLKGCMDSSASNYKTYYVYPDPEACAY